MIGYDKYSINHQLLLGLPFEEMSGAAGAPIYDRAKPHHTCTLRGATIAWNSLASGLPYIEFTPGTPDFIDCPAAATADLNFTTGDFSMTAWVYLDHLWAVDRMIMCRGLALVDGWTFRFTSTHLPTVGDLEFGTYQLGTSQFSDCLPGATTITAWYFLGVSRSGSSVRIFSQGRDVTVPGVHINPTTANRELHIGISEDEITQPFDGKMWYPRIWGRQLSAAEMRRIFQAERHWFGV